MGGLTGIIKSTHDYTINKRNWRMRCYLHSFVRHRHHNIESTHSSTQQTNANAHIYTYKSWYTWILGYMIDDIEELLWFRIRMNNVCFAFFFSFMFHGYSEYLSVHKYYIRAFFVVSWIEFHISLLRVSDDERSRLYK